MRRALLLLMLVVLPLTLLSACASDGSADSIDTMRSESVRPESTRPEGLTDVRESLASQRAETNSRLDGAMGAADTEASWYGPIFDALDVAASLGGLLY